MRSWELTRLYAVQAGVEGGVGGGMEADGFSRRAWKLTAALSRAIRWMAAATPYLLALV